MENQQVKVELTVGTSSLSFAGAEDLFREAFPDLLEKVLSAPVARGVSISPTENGIKGVGDTRPDLDIVGVCQALNVDSGPTLVMAACVKLSVIDGKRSFSYNELRHEVNGAHGYVTDSRKKNMKQNLQSLVRKHELNQEKKDTYALSGEQRAEYGRRINHR